MQRSPATSKPYEPFSILPYLTSLYLILLTLLEGFASLASILLLLFSHLFLFFSLWASSLVFTKGSFLLIGCALTLTQPNSLSFSYYLYADVFKISTYFPELYWAPTTVVCATSLSICLSCRILKLHMSKVELISLLSHLVLLSFCIHCLISATINDLPSQVKTEG